MTHILLGELGRTPRRIRRAPIPMTASEHLARARRAALFRRAHYRYVGSLEGLDGFSFKKIVRAIKKPARKYGPGAFIKKGLGDKKYKQIIQRPLKRYGVPVAVAAGTVALTILTAGASAPLIPLLVGAATTAVTTGAGIAVSEYGRQQEGKANRAIEQEQQRYEREAAALLAQSGTASNTPSTNGWWGNIVDDLNNVLG